MWKTLLLNHEPAENKSPFVLPIPGDNYVDSCGNVGHLSTIVMSDVDNTIVFNNLSTKLSTYPPVGKTDVYQHNGR